jgi:cytochrome c peroxidase
VSAPAAMLAPLLLLAQIAGPAPPAVTAAPGIADASAAAPAAPGAPAAAVVPAAAATRVSAATPAAAPAREEPEVPAVNPAPTAGLAVPFAPDELARILRHSPLPAAPLDPTNAVSDDPRAARLGQALFFDARFSADGNVSCASCHAPERAFADGRVLAQGVGEASRHAPALWNVADNRWYFWDGRADSLWAQALGPLENPVEHATSRLAVVRTLAADEELRRAYQNLFGQLPELSQAARALPAARPVPEDGSAPEHLAWLSLPAEERRAIDLVFSHVGKCLAAYVRLIRSDHSPFDVFVEGLRDGDPAKLAALSPSAQRGLQIFTGRGNCRSCHSGPNFTDREFHSVRVPSASKALGRDPGRYAGITKVLTDPFNGLGEFSDDRGAAARDKLAFLDTRTSNQGQFKTPSLRNVAVTAPYMHQGQLATLRDVLRHYSTFDDAFDPLKGHFEQTLQPLDLTAQETDDLLAFLESLTDIGLDPALMSPPPSPR